MKDLLVFLRSKLGSLAIITLITSVCGCLIYAESRNSALPDDFKVGDRVEVSVSGLEGDRYYEPCVVTEVRGNGYSVKCSGTEYAVQRGWVRTAKTREQPNRPMQNIEPNRAAAPARPQDQTNEQLFKRFDGNESGWLSGRELQACQCIQFDKDGDNEVTRTEFIVGMGGQVQPANDPGAARAGEANGECASNAPPINRSGTLKPSEMLFKGLLFYNYNLKANGTGQAPLKVGVEFQNLEIGASFANTVTNVPYVGAVRKNDAAPVNAMIYKIRSKHIVCEQYRDGIKRRQVEGNYACFKNRDGEWICGIDGIPKIVQLN